MATKNEVESENCLTRQVLEIFSDKWTPYVIYVLSLGTQRTGELGRQIPGISKKMLTQSLRNLEAWGLVKRTVYHEVPPKVEYSLTPLGKTFMEPIEMLYRWATENASIVRNVAALRKKK